MRQMRVAKGTAVHVVEVEQNELKDQIAGYGRRVNELLLEKKRLEQKRHALHLLRMEIEHKENVKIAKFIEENKTDERKLSDVSDYCLVNELAARGFTGRLDNEAKSPDLMAGLNFRLGGEYITPPNIAELVGLHEHNDGSDESRKEPADE